MQTISGEEMHPLITLWLALWLLNKQSIDYIRSHNYMSEHSGLSINAIMDYL